MGLKKFFEKDVVKAAEDVGKAAEDVGKATGDFVEDDVVGTVDKGIKEVEGTAYEA